MTAAGRMSDMADNKDMDKEKDKTESAQAKAEETEKTDVAEAAETDMAKAEAEEAKKAESDTAGEAKACDAEETSAEQTGDSAGEPDKEQSEESDEQSESADAKPDKKDKQIEELNDRYRRLFAEFDNFRKRSEAEKTGMFAEGERTVLLKILPLIDNFERALGSIPEEQKGTALAEGIDKTYKAFAAQLTELGVTPIEATGKTFDANLHNAVMHVEDDNAEENMVVEEFQKGYMFKDKVLRYSMVKVAN